MTVPRVVNLQVVRTCNLRCSFCSHHVWKDETGMMEFGLFTRIISSLRADSCPCVAFVSAQGESLLHPRIMDMLAIAKDAGFEVNLVTNGTPLTPKRIKELAKLNLDSIQFSFCGYDAPTYEALYVGAKFDRVVNNLKQLVIALKRTRTYLSINGIGPVDILEPTRDFLHSLGLIDNQIHLNPLHNWGGTIGEKATGKVTKICPLLVSTPGIYIDGRVTACGCIDANGALGIGEITKNSIVEIRQQKPYQDMVGAFRSGDVSCLPLCRDCQIPR